MKAKKKIRMMSLSIALLFTVICCVYSSGAKVFAESYGQELLITEVMPYSQSGDDAYEFIELYNNSSSRMDLKNYRLPKQNVDITFSKVIQPKAVMVICTRSTTSLESFNSFYGTSLTQDKYMNLPAVGELLSSTSKDNIILAKDDGAVAAEAQYDTVNFAVKKSITYKYAASGYEMNLLGQKQNPTPGSVSSDQVLSGGTSVTGVSLDRQNLNMEAGKTAVLHAAVYPSTAANKSLLWTSEDPDIANVDGNGVVTAKGEGTTVVTVTTVDGGYNAYCTVTVGRIPVTGITLDKSSITLKTGQAIILTASITPQNATNKSVLWYSSNSSAAEVNKDGIVTAKAQGSAVITVKTVDGSFTASCSVIINGTGAYIPVKGVSLNKTSVNMEKGSAMLLEAQINPIDATNKNVKWTSSNSSIASVNEYGIVSAKKEGTCSILVKTAEGGYIAYCVINVTGSTDTRAVKDVELNKSFIFVKKGKAEKLEARILPGNAQNKAVSWESSDTKIAQVNSQGWVTGVKEGFALITVTTKDGNHTDECLVIVTGDKGQKHDNGKKNGHWKWKD